jgi:DNA-binding beta-propeller fold protein YncE
MVAVGAGRYTYEVVKGWGKLPRGWKFTQVAGVAVDSKDRVYVFNRGEHPMIVFDRAGSMVAHWGEELFSSAHGIFIDAQDNIYTADVGNHVIRKFDRNWKLVMTLGDVDKPAEKMSGKPFNLPTNVAVSPVSGDIFVTDGYGNARVHRYTAEGAHVLSWGEPGTGPGQFVIPHGIAFDKQGTVYVADRENLRIQLFTDGGKYLSEWGGFARPDEMYIDKDGIMYVAELGQFTGLGPDDPQPTPDSLPARVSVVDSRGKLLARWGGEKRAAIGDFEAPHGIWTDSRGDLYVGEVMDGQRIQKFARKG